MGNMTREIMGVGDMKREGISSGMQYRETWGSNRAGKY